MTSDGGQAREPLDLNDEGQKAARGITEGPTIPLVDIDATPDAAREAGEAPPDATTNPESLAPVSARIPRFLGEYEIISELARGGMGIVYRALQGNLGRVVALKLIRDPSLAT